MQMLRISVGDVTNMFTETIDDTDRPSNQVTTHTPDQTPSISLEKYDLASGVDVSGDEGKGNRDTPEAALPVTGEPIGLGYLITNTGAVPLTSLTLTDTTITGNGTVSQMVWPEGWNEESTLEPGESITVTATLSGVTTDHTNIGTVTAIPILACPMVDDNPWDDNPAATPDGMCTAETLTADDPWNATIAPPIPGVSVETGGTIQPDTGTPVPLWALLGASLLMAGGVIAGVVFWRRRRKGGR